MAAGGGARELPPPPARPPRRGASDLGPRVMVAIPAIAVAGVLVGFGGWVFVAGVFVLGAFCLHELFEMYAFTNPSRLAGFIALAGLLVAAQAGEQDTVLLAFMATIPLVFLLCISQARHSGMPGVAVTVLGLAWIGLALAHGVMLRELPHGDKVVIVVLVGTFIGDTAAYMGGRMFGRRRLSPRISPNKTVEGLVIGFVTGVAAVWFAGLYADWLSGVDALILGTAIAIFGPVGDLFESYLKRDAGTKDTGRLFGAHGGALDRLDAVLFTAVVGFYVWKAML
ncbi:MAG: phosphatidate cytidylyltransferase [Solirubrobacteraceae bacterium]|jgi:phosphatidate cytidylyltransferase|nr:phosphatidate cytidylyltransferase [Solirubrobacteraceae bacterium]